MLRSPEEAGQIIKNRTGARNQLGSKGEDLVAQYLQDKGYQILAQNLAYKQGEIDLLAKDGETIVLVEVKTQQKLGVIDPVYRLTPAKQRKLRLLAEIISTKYPSQNVRIDAVLLYWKQSQAHYNHLINII